MIKVNGLSVSRIPINGKETLRVMRNGQQLWSGTGLPAGYTLLEYIENTSDSWINTGFIANGGMKACIGIVPYDLTQSYVFFGSHNPNNYGGDPTWQRNYLAILNNSLLEVGQSTNFAQFTTPVLGNSIHEIEFSTIVNKAPYVYIDGEYFEGDYIPDLSIRPITPVYILRDPYTNSKYLKSKIYYAKIYDSNLNLVRDYIPCMNPDGVCGLYDRIGRKFYQSASSTPFIGEYYKEVEFIESDGTQYIDTGISISPSIGRKLKYVIDSEMTGSLGAANINGSGWGAAPYNNSFYVGFLGWQIYYGNGRVDVATGITNIDNNRHLFTYDAKNGIVSVSDIYETSFSYQTPDEALPLILFGYSQANGIPLHPEKMYSCKIYEEDILVRDFIPVKGMISGTYGLYDKVNKQFYTSASSTGFIGA